MSVKWGSTVLDYCYGVDNPISDNPTNLSLKVTEYVHVLTYVHMPLLYVHVTSVAKC